MAGQDQDAVGRRGVEPASTEPPPQRSWPPRPDLLAALAREHRDLDALGRWLVARDDASRPVATLRGFLTQMTVHEVCEEVLVDPLVRTRLGHGELAERRSAEQRSLLAALDAGRDELPTGAALRSLLDRFVEHSDREELEVFPPLRHVLTAGELLAGWQRLKLLRARVPRRARQRAGTSTDTWGSATALEVARSLAERTGAPSRAMTR